MVPSDPRGRRHRRRSAIAAANLAPPTPSPIRFDRTGLRTACCPRSRSSRRRCRPARAAAALRAVSCRSGASFASGGRRRRRPREPLPRPPTRTESSSEERGQTGDGDVLRAGGIRRLRTRHVVTRARDEYTVTADNRRVEQGSPARAVIDAAASHAASRTPRCWPRTTLCGRDVPARRDPGGGRRRPGDRRLPARAPVGHLGVQEGSPRPARGVRRPPGVAARRRTSAASRRAGRARSARARNSCSSPMCSARASPRTAAASRRSRSWSSSASAPTSSRATSSRCVPSAPGTT